MNTKRIFKELKVLPSYGKDRALIVWEVDSEFKSAGVVVFRSKDETTWHVIYSGTGDTQAIDRDFVIRDRLTNYFYRVEVTKDGKTHKSDVVSTFGQVPRMTYGTANCILQDWGKRIQQSTEIKIYKQLIFGNPCPVCVDIDTGQRVGTTLCKTCFGTGYEHGFAEPISSFMLKATEPARATLDMEDGKGTRDAQICQVRMLAYPSTRRGDMIVDVGRDDRYLVGASTRYDVGGKITILYDVELELLRRNDIRYSV